MDAKATAKYLERRISDAVKEANQVRAEAAEGLAKPLTKGSRSTSAHTLDRLIDFEAVAVAWLEIHETAGGDVEKVGHEEFLEAVRKVRGEIQQYLRTSRHANTGTYATQQMAQHNAATKVLSGTDVIELIDENEEN
jgi:threonine synthase